MPTREEIDKYYQEAEFYDEGLTPCQALIEDLSYA